MAAAGIAGVWIMTDGQVARVDAPASEPADPRPAGITDGSGPGTGLSIDDMMRQLTDAMAGRTFCDAPPVEMTDEQKQLLEKVLSTLPPPPTVPGQTDGDVINIHRHVVPC